MINQTVAHTINQMLQERLSSQSMGHHMIRVEFDGEMSIFVNGKIYHAINDIEDATIRNLIQETVQDWILESNQIPKRVSRHRENGKAILLFFLLPLLLSSCLFSLNASYMNELLIREQPYIYNSSFPVGWFLIMVILGLSITAWGVHIFLKARASSSAWISHLRLIITATLIAIACLIVMLGPAALQLIRGSA